MNGIRSTSRRPGVLIIATLTCTCASALALHTHDPLGRTTLADSTGGDQVALAYDAFGNLACEIQTIAGVSKTFHTYRRASNARDSMPRPACAMSSSPDSPTNGSISSRRTCVSQASGQPKGQNRQELAMPADRLSPTRR